MPVIYVRDSESGQFIPIPTLKGDKGEKGDSGKAATVSLGSFSTGDAGSDVIITNTGTSESAVFNFTIPRGDQGLQGKEGKAATIEVGTVTTGEAGSNATVTNAGTPNAAKLNFTIPRGEVGAKGDDGYTPKKGTDYWTETDRQSIVSEVLNNTSHRYVTKTISLTSWQTVSENVFTSSFTDTKIPPNCKLDISFDTQDLLQLMNDGVSNIRADNDNGTVNVICIGAKPTTNLNAQISFVKIVQS